MKLKVELKFLLHVEQCALISVSCLICRDRIFVYVQFSREGSKVLAVLLVFKCKIFFRVNQSIATTVRNIFACLYSFRMTNSFQNTELPRKVNILLILLI